MAYVIPTIFSAVDKFSSPVNRMNHALDKFSNAGDKAFKVGRQAAVAGAAIAAPLILAAKAAIDFEDRMADVAKTTGLSGAPLAEYSAGLIEMSKNTRTSISDLQAIGVAGGTLGVPKEQLLEFTKAADQFAIALADDFGGVDEAVTQVSKIKNLFTQTRDLDVSQVITRAGSAINELSNQAGSASNINDFVLRVGAMPDAMKPSIQATAALGAYLEESGVNSEVASSGFANFMARAGDSLPAFAKQMGISKAAAEGLYNTDPVTFATKFSQSLKGMSGTQVNKTFDKLKINSIEIQKVVGALGSNVATAEKSIENLTGTATSAFSDATSIGDEAAKKNETAAAKAAMLMNNLKGLAIDLGTALLPVINEVVSSITPFIQGLSDWIKRNKTLTGSILKAAGILSAFLFAVSAVSFVVGGFQKVFAAAKVAMTVYSKATQFATTVQYLWNLALEANPIGLIIVAVAALAAGVYLLSKAFDTSTVAERLNAEVRSEAMSKTVDQRAELMLLFNTLRNAKEGTTAYTNALQKINEISPGIIEKYNLQEKSLDRIAQAERFLARDIMKRAEAEVRAEKFKESVRKYEDLIENGPSTMDRVKGLFGDQYSYQRSLVEEKQKQQVLLGQITQDQISATPALNPEKEKQDAMSKSESTETSKVEISFSGLPEGAKAILNGGNSLLFPSLTSTSK